MNLQYYVLYMLPLVRSYVLMGASCHGRGSLPIIPIAAGHISIS